MKIPKVFLSHKGTYICIGSNGNGARFEAETFVDVNAASSAMPTLTYIAFGYLLIQAIWSKNLNMKIFFVKNCIEYKS